MKRVFYVAAACVVLLFCLPLHAFAAIDFDGSVYPMEWYDYPATELFQQPSLCGVTNATVRVAVQPAQSRVMFGFTAVAPGVTAESPVGAAFLLGGQELGRWQQGPGASFDAANYDLRGLANIPADSANNGCTFEIALGYKNDAALAALRNLSVQLFDPQGVPSRPAACPIVTAEPVTTTKATTTEKTTTTKAPTTEKPTTAKAATTLPVYTTAPPAYTQAAASRAPAAPQVTAAPPAAVRQTQPGTSRTEVFYYTAVYTAAPSNTAAQLGTLTAYAPQPAESSQAQALPTLAMPAAQASRSESLRTPLLYAAGGLLILLAATLAVFWLRAQKKPAEPM